TTSYGRLVFTSMRTGELTAQSSPVVLSRFCAQARSGVAPRAAASLGNSPAVQFVHDRLDDHGRAAAVGVDLDRGHLAIDREPGLQQRPVGGTRVHPGEQRAG